MPKYDVLKKLRKGFGFPDESEFDPEIFLLKINKQVKDLTIDISKQVDRLVANAQAERATVQQLAETNNSAELLKQLIEIEKATQQAISERKIEKVIIERETPPREIKVSVNPQQGPLPDSHKNFFSALFDVGVKAPMDAFRQWLQDALSSIQKPENAIAVRLVEPDGSNFYRAIMSAVVAAAAPSTTSGGSIDITTLAKDASLQSILAAIQAGIAVTGTVTVNTISGFALETGGNLAALVAKDFATQTTLALIKAKTDNLDTALSGIKTGTDKIPSSPATSGKQDTGNTSIASVDTKLGEVQSSPTANTVLDRLKQLLTGIILAAGSAVIGKTSVDPADEWSMYTGSIKATATSVKSSAGRLGGWYIFNPNTSTVYVQIFNLATGSITLGTTAPTMSLGIPAGAAANIELKRAATFGTAISYAVTTTRAGSSNPSSNTDVNFLYQ